MKEAIKLLEETIKRIENLIDNTHNADISINELDRKITCLNRAKKEAISSLVTLKYINQ